MWQFDCKIHHAQKKSAVDKPDVPDIPGGRSTGRLLWAACSQTQPHTRLGLEQGPGHDAGKLPRCQQGAAAGTQTQFPDPPVAASLWTHIRKSWETCGDMAHVDLISEMSVKLPECIKSTTWYHSDMLRNMWQSFPPIYGHTQTVSVASEGNYEIGSGHENSNSVSSTKMPGG